METVQLTEPLKTHWDEYVSSLPPSYFYHDYRWKEVIEKSFGHKTFYLLAIEDKKIVGTFPLVFIKSIIMKPCLVSLAFLNYGGIAAQNEMVASSLLDKASEILKKLGGGYIEMRHWDKSNLPLATREHKVTMLLKLPGSEEDQWAALDKKVRNQIRKAQKSGLVVHQGKGELLDSFYRVFCRNMRDLGTPVLGKPFFFNVLKYFPQESYIFIVSYQGKSVAAGFTLSHHSVTEIPWASSLHSFNELCPNMLLYWEVIRHAISRGCQQFDFGRCTKNSGTYDFKKQWNPEVHPLYWQYWADQEDNLPSMNLKENGFKLPFLIWKKLPLFITNPLGPLIARNLPAF